MAAAGILFGPHVSAACGKASEADFALGQGDVVLVAPFNLTVPLSPELSGQTAPVGVSLVSYLLSQGAEVDSLSADYAQSIWRSQLSTTAGGAVPCLVDVCGGLVRELATRESFDYMVVPTLVPRLARVSRDRARWDGVRRPLGSDATRRPAGLGGELAGAGFDVRVSGISGRMGAASLHVSVLDREGRVVYSGIGGLSLLQSAHHKYSAGRTTSAMELKLRPEPFAEERELAQGVKIAFEDRREAKDPSKRRR